MANDEPKKDQLDVLLRHVAHTARMPQPPANFAREVAQQVRDLPEEAGVESWLTRAVVLVAAIAVAAFAVPFVVVVGARITQLLEGAPWPLLLAAGFVFVGMQLVDYARSGAPDRRTTQ